MKKNKPDLLVRYRAIAFTGLFLGALISCQNDDLTNDTTTSNLEAREQYLNEDIPDGISDFVITEQYSTDPNAKTVVEENCMTKNISFNQTDSDFFLLDPNSSLLWPGNLLASRSIQEGAPVSIPIYGEDRNPIEVKINVLSGTSASTHRTIPAPTPGKVQDNLNTILNNYYDSGANFPASFQISIERIHNEQQLQFALGAGYSGPSVDVSGKLGINFNEQKTRFAVTLQQRFFTTSVSPKENIIGQYGWLNNNVAPKRLDPYVTDFKEVSADQANPSSFIESVTYGRLYTMIYESTERASEVEAALKFAYNGLGNVNSELNVRYKKIFKNATVKVRQLGGNPADGIASSLSGLANNLDKVVEFLAKGAEVSRQNPGYPISYKVNYVKNNRPFKVTQNIRYKVKTCDLVNYETIRIDPLTVHLSKGDDHGTHGAELFGRLYVEKYDAKNRRWYSVDGTIYWGYGVEHRTRDYYPLNGKKREIGKEQVIDFKVKTGSGQRFRVVSEVGECDARCRPYIDTELPNGRRYITYQYNSQTKKWEDFKRHNPYVPNYNIGTSFYQRTWNGARSKVNGGIVTYVDYLSYVIKK
ncbi:thiol-activated cytolysin [Aquimarina sp. MAR_2010_214]|uniref:thiol-activated cytolysin family protein n=1 Tax=Aquimarina sp. MAR_2010_214 TaxID=1250026 RepID=UPI000C713092|nr:thiol-activated cytolysin family protein [Aquimarina sp. MAR_2010_214]PKV48383.1 thiol-activated cytolysin [Aquimarina sp. MAR_2010_214]